MGTSSGSVHDRFACTSHIPITTPNTNCPTTQHSKQPCQHSVLSTASQARPIRFERLTRHLCTWNLLLALSLYAHSRRTISDLLPGIRKLNDIRHHPVTTSTNLVSSIPFLGSHQASSFLDTTSATRKVCARSTAPRALSLAERPCPCGIYAKKLAVVSSSITRVKALPSRRGHREISIECRAEKKHGGGLCPELCLEHRVNGMKRNQILALLHPPDHL